MKHIIAGLAMVIVMMGFGQPALSRSQVTDVDRPGHGPFVIITVITDDKIETAFAELIKVIKWKIENGEQDYQQLYFKFGIPVVDNYGNKSIGPAIDVTFTEDVKAKDLTSMTAVDLLKISYPRNVTRAGWQWGHEYCGSTMDMVRRIPFCGQFIR